MNTIQRFFLGVSLVTVFVSATVAETGQTGPAQGVSSTKAPSPSDLWAQVADDVARMDGRTIRKEELAQAFAGQFPDGKVPEGITSREIAAIAPQFLRQHIQSQLLVAIAKDSGVEMNSDVAYQSLKAEWEALADQDAQRLQAELAAQKKTLDEYAHELAKRQAIQDTLCIQAWIKATIAENGPVTEADVLKFYEEHKYQFRAKDGKTPAFADLSRQIRDFLEKQQTQDMVSGYVSAAEKSRGVEYFLAVPSQGFGGCAPGGCSPTCD